MSITATAPSDAVAQPLAGDGGHCSPSGNVKLLNNFLVNSGTPASRNASSVAATPYSYTVDANNSVKSIVTGAAGTGKI